MDVHCCVHCQLAVVDKTNKVDILGTIVDI